MFHVIALRKSGLFSLKLPRRKISVNFVLYNAKNRKTPKWIFTFFSPPCVFPPSYRTRKRSAYSGIESYFLIKPSGSCCPYEFAMMAPIFQLQVQTSLAIFYFLGWLPITHKTNEMEMAEVSRWASLQNRIWKSSSDPSKSKTLTFEDLCMLSRELDCLTDLFTILETQNQAIHVRKFWLTDLEALWLWKGRQGANIIKTGSSPEKTNRTPSDISGLLRCDLQPHS